jgi:ankyrin repeat protein
VLFCFSWQQGLTALLLAVARRDAAMVQRLLDAGADPNVSKRVSNETLLLSVASSPSALI